MKHLRTLLVIVSAGASAGTCFGQLDVFYTGRMMGYHRYPDKQTIKDSECPTDTQRMSLPGQDLFGLREKAGIGKGSLLVGMGDNFAPELEARTFAGTTPAEGKDLFLYVNGNWIPDSTAKGYTFKGATLPMDNVGCFISAMQYAALVPGKHDFYFGPDRLRLLAKDLQERGTKMLAANLSIATREPDTKPRKPLYEIEDELVEKKNNKLPNGKSFTVMPPEPENKASRADGPVSIKLPDVVMPWMRAIEVSNAFTLSIGGIRVNFSDLPQGAKLVASKAKDAPEVSPIGNGGPFYVQTGEEYRDADTPGLIANELVICETPTVPDKAKPDTKIRDPYAFYKATSRDCWSLKAEHEVKAGQSLKGAAVFKLKDDQKLRADQNYVACVRLRDGVFTGSAKYYCQPFYVAEPFFANASGDEKPFVIREVTTKAAKSPAGVIYPAGAQERKSTVAIFGLLDPDLLGNIGKLNYGWWHKNTNYETTAQISGLTDALSQAMMACEADKVCGDKNTRKILLAQMPAAKATQLLANIKEPLFELVITETDANNATRAGNSARKATETSSSPKFVVVPDAMYDGSAVTSRIHKATIGCMKEDCTECKPDAKDAATWTVEHQIFVSDKRPQGPDIVAPINCESDKTRLRCVAISALVREGVRERDEMKNWSTKQVLQNLALIVMQKRRFSDVSLLQGRDLFRPEAYGSAKVDTENLQETLDRMFWKGDYAVRIPVTGATLKSILQSSTDFATLEANPTNTDLERGRSLASIGYFKEAADSNLTVNGANVDPAKVYSVTMTDFLAMGDTGYTPIKTPLVPYPYRIKDFKDYESISAMVCRSIRSAALPEAHCHSPLFANPKADTHLDVSTALPPDQTAGATSVFQAKTYVDIKSRISRFKQFYLGRNAAEFASAQKRYWAFDLEKGDFGLKANRPSSAAVNSSQFAGISLADVTAPMSYAISFDDRARLRYVTQHIDWFFQHESNFAYTRTDSKSGFTRSLGQNLVAGETGVLGHLLWKNGRKPQGFDLLGAVRVESGVFRPRNDLALTTPQPTEVGRSSPPAGTLLGRLDRQIDVFAKAGVRYTDERSWFEAGYMAGHSEGNPAALVFPGIKDPIKLIPGTKGYKASCPVGAALNSDPAKPCHSPNPEPETFADWISYYSGGVRSDKFPVDGTITSTSKYTVNYTARPISGFFLNFSVNVPLPIGHKYPDWAGGKPIALLLENTGKWLFDYATDLPTQTKYYDKLAMSMVIPVVGNLSLKPEIDALYYQNKNSPMLKTFGSSFHGFNYQATLSYSFSWRQGLPLSRMWRYSWPTPTSSVPASGR